MDVTCRSFKTMELKHEYAKRRRNYKGTKSAKQTLTPQSNGERSANTASSSARGEQEKEANPDESGQRRETTANLNSSKFHALGHVVASIVDVGTTDSYSGEIVSPKLALDSQLRS